MTPAPVKDNTVEISLVLDKLINANINVKEFLTNLKEKMTTYTFELLPSGPESILLSSLGSVRKAVLKFDSQHKINERYYGWKDLLPTSRRVR